MAAHTFLVTGVSRGIGRAIADRLVARGDRVVGLARTPPSKGFTGIFHACDLADTEVTAGTLARIVADHAIDGVVNNAAINVVGRLGQVDLNDFDAMVELNLRAAIQVTQAALPGMRRRGWGRVVNIASRTALGKTGRTVYGATKAALIGMTRTWALELARDGITVNAVSPGPIDTELFRSTNPPDSPTTRTIMADIPAGRLGRPEEVAAAVTFLASEDAGFITGQTLSVCGGLTVGYAGM
ncbi:MAG: SDR family oxidoreductase [Alphaproteobacteria bacterium]|nr:SDR family oxidoreductase [Alphaproteobacteria bacterium]